MLIACLDLQFLHDYKTYPQNALKSESVEKIWFLRCHITKDKIQSYDKPPNELKTGQSMCEQVISLSADDWSQDYIKICWKWFRMLVFV